MPFMTPPQSYMKQTPQENQFLSGNPSVQPEANTSWMNPSSSDSGWAQTTPSPNPSPSMSTGGLMGNGTALSALTAGSSLMPPNFNPSSYMGNTGVTGGIDFNGATMGGPGNNPGAFPGMGGNQAQPSGGVGQYIPEGYDQSKLNDPANANSLKYQVGRILSNFDPNGGLTPEIGAQLQALGASIVGKDTIRLPDGTTVDVGRAFSDTTPGAKKAWQYNWSGPAGGSSQGGNANPTSYMGNAQPQQGGMMNNLMQQIMFQMQQNQNKNRFNQMGINNGQTMFMGGGVVDPVTGIRRNPRPGEPQ